MAKTVKGVVTKMDINGNLYDVQGSDTNVEWAGNYSEGDYDEPDKAVSIGTLTVNTTDNPIIAPPAEELRSKAGNPPILSINGNTPNILGELAFNSLRFMFGSYDESTNFRAVLNALDPDPQEWDIAILYKDSTDTIPATSTQRGQ